MNIYTIVLGNKVAKSFNQIKCSATEKPAKKVINPTYDFFCSLQKVQKIFLDGYRGVHEISAYIFS